MARAGFYVVFRVVLFLLLDWGPAGDSVPPQGVYVHRMNMYLFSPQRSATMTAQSYISRYVMWRLDALHDGYFQQGDFINF